MNQKDRNFAEMDCYFWKDDAQEWKGQRTNNWFVEVSVPTWSILSCTYDNVTSEFHGYIDGVHHSFDGAEYGGVKRWQSWWQYLWVT